MEFINEQRFGLRWRAVDVDEDESRRSKTDKSKLKLE